MMLGTAAVIIDKEEEEEDVGEEGGRKAVKSATLSDADRAQSVRARIRCSRREEEEAEPNRRKSRK